jgi:hypothetical protein
VVDQEWGVIEKVDIVGQPYEVQTELVDPDALRVRTTVFHNGRVVACRDARLHRSETGVRDPETARELMVLHHQNVLHGFARRTSEYLARRSRTEVGRTSARRSPEVVGEDLASELPPTPEDPAVADAVDVRRLVTGLRERLEATSPELEAGDPTGWLAAASSALDEVIDHPRFSAVRIDEQVLFHQLRERVREAARGSADVGSLRVLHDDLMAFCAYSSGINRRSDLVAFDRHLLAWSLAVIRREQSVLSVRSAVGWLRGRDPKLDVLLAELATADLSTIVSELERVLHDIS